MTHSACDFMDDVFAELHRIGTLSDAEYNDPTLEDNPSLATSYALTAIRRLDAAVEVLKQTKRLCDEALPKFNWGASALDANAIALLNSVPQNIEQVLEKLK